MGTSCTHCWYKSTSCVEHTIEKLFFKWGHFVADHPLITIICSLILTGILGVFIIFMEEEANIEQLYAPKNSVSWNNHIQYTHTWQEYEDEIGENTVIVFDKLSPSKNILTLEHITLFLSIYNNITGIEIEYKDEIYKYDDICYKYENGNCKTESILEIYHFNQQLIEQTFNTELITYPTHYSYYSGQQLFIPLVLGQNITTQFIDISSSNSTNKLNANLIPPNAEISNPLEDGIQSQINSNYIQTVTASPAFKMIFNLDISKFGEELCLKWYQEFLNTMELYVQNDNNILYVAYQGYNSFNDELNRAVASDVNSFVIAFVLLGSFSTLCMLRFTKIKLCNCIPFCKLDKKRCRGRVAWAGTVSAMMAVVSSFGVVGGIMGIKFNPVVSVAPFLLVGLGLDDMFVLVRAYELTSTSLTIKERTAMTMKRGGISILFTSITDLVAFCIGFVSPFGSVSAFSMYCGIGVLFDFLYQVSFFLAIMVYDSRLQLKDDTVCCKSNVKTVSEIELEVASKNNTDCRMRKLSDYTTPTMEEKRSSWLMDRLGACLLSSWIIKLFVVLLFVIYLIGATFGVMQLETYQNPEDLAPNDSHLRDSYKATDTYFNSIGAPIQFVIDKPLDYSNPNVVQSVDKLTTFIRNDNCFLNDFAFTTSWVRSFYDYLNVYYFNVNISTDMFYDILYNEYLVSDEGKQFIPDIWDTITFNVSNIIQNDTFEYISYNYSIERSRLKLVLKPLGVGTEGVKNCLDNFKHIQNEYKSELNAYYYAFFTIFAESELITVQQTIYCLLYSSIAASIITIILIPYPLMALIVMSTVIQILFGVLGYMSLWGLPINTTTMINLVISVGFSVDNSAHFCHAFMNAPLNIKFKSKSEERKARVIYAYNAVGMPILQGDLSTIVALIPLSTAQSQIFISFWKCISLVMLFGISYAIFYLPVVLSIIGPLGFNQIINDTNKKNETDKMSKEKKHQFVIQVTPTVRTTPVYVQ